MPLYKLYEEMSYEELCGWFNYLERRPVDWRADDRTSKLLQAQGVKESPAKLFPSLAAVYNKPKEGFDVQGLKSSALFQKMLDAKGGDRIKYD